MYYYTMFNHTIECDFEIEEGIAIDKIDNADIRIEEKLPPKHVMDAIADGKFDDIKKDVAWFYVKDMFVYCIENGNHIIVHQVVDKVKEYTKTTFITGLAMAICLTQRGLVPMHGGAICVDDAGFIITGASGSGKSSTTTQVRDKGGVFMADDIGVIDTATNELLPGFPVQKLCANMVDILKLDKSELRYIGEFRDKYAQSLSKDQYLYEKRPLKAIFEIKKADVSDVVFEEVTGSEKLKIITDNIYCVFYVKNMPMEPESMIRYLKIAKDIKVFRVLRPEGKDTLAEISDWVYNTMKNEAKA